LKSGNPGNTFLRRIIKIVLIPIKGGGIYSALQALAVGLDIKLRRLFEPEVDLLALALRPGETALDLGANFGLYAYHLSRAVGRHGKVVCFEPIPYTFLTLSKVVRLLGLKNVVLKPYGVADRPGVMHFSVPLQSNGHIMAGQAFIGGRNDDQGDRSQQVRWNRTKQVECLVTTVDSECLDAVDVSFLKVDIEGAEIFALRGARRTIENFRPTVLIEINPWFLDGFGVKIDDLINPFIELGYRLYIYDEGQGNLKLIGNFDQIVERNYLLIHSKFIDRFAAKVFP